MTSLKPYMRHIKSKEDLKTTYEETRAGFIAFALEKNRRSTPYIERARALKISASVAKHPVDLLQIEDIQGALLTASGISDKAMKYLDDSHKQEAIKGLIEQFLEPAGQGFIDELVFRYLLIQGDALGGSMRNVAGAMAQQKLTRAIIAALDISDIDYKWLGKNNQWYDRPEDDYDIESQAKGLNWTHNNHCRTLIYNLTVPLVRKNVDMCLFDCTAEDFRRTNIRKINERYLLLGELKGGIDPAGADEHWKTANTALSRIRSAFQSKSLNPYTIFVGAAIENSMAEEIWNQLEEGTMTNVANLTSADQVGSLCNWLIRL